MTPSEKHMETARNLVGGILMNDLDVVAVAAVVASIERDGMKRAAEIAREEAERAKNSIIIPMAYNIIADRILSEAGEE